MLYPPRAAILLKSAEIVGKKLGAGYILAKMSFTVSNN